MQDDSIKVTQHHVQQMIEDIHAMVLSRLPPATEFRLPAVFIKAVSQK